MVFLWIFGVTHIHAIRINNVLFTPFTNAKGLVFCLFHKASVTYLSTNCGGLYGGGADGIVSFAAPLTSTCALFVLCTFMFSSKKIVNLAVAYSLLQKVIAK